LLAVEIHQANGGSSDIGFDLDLAATFKHAFIAGTVFNDANSNSIHDVAESGLSGWTVYLDTNNNNVLDVGESTATTNEQGHYLFTNLAAGTYYLKQSLKSGHRKTLPSGSPGYVLPLSAADVAVQDFGDTTNILLGGVVFNDANKNGVRDAGEAALP